jgi:hypothetical protein
VTEIASRPQGNPRGLVKRGSKWLEF